MEKQKVEVFELTDPTQRALYEHILNTYRVIKEEFAYIARSGEPKVTVWYLKEED
jgi:hypothetical protein